MLPGVFSVIDHRWREKVVKKKCDTRVAGDCVTDVFTTFRRHLWSMTEQTQGNMESICSKQWSEKKKTSNHKLTFLVLLDCSRICASL